jgi:hypothetical protein
MVCIFISNLKFLHQIQGSKTQAEEGTLIILAAGDRTLFDDCQSCFKAMSKNSFYLGSSQLLRLRTRRNLSYDTSCTSAACVLLPILVLL